MKKIFIIHGWTYTLDAWTECLVALRGMGYEPVMLNVPGLTETSDLIWTLEGYVDWLGIKLKDEEHVTLVGHSNGGRIALAYQARHPGKIEKLILLDAAGIVHNEPALQFQRKMFGMLARTGKKFLPSLFLRKIFYRLIGGNDYERAPENMRETMKNLISIDLSSELSKIKIPTLIIWGKKDTSTPVSDAYVMNKGIVGSELMIIDDTGHSPHKTHPAVVAKKIDTWLKSRV